MTRILACRRCEYRTSVNTDTPTLVDIQEWDYELHRWIDHQGEGS